MQLNLEQIEDLVGLLGRRGALSGLRDSNFAKSTFIELAQSLGIKASDSDTKSGLIEAIVEFLLSKRLKTAEQLMEMKYGDLINYFDQVEITNTELYNLATHAGIQVAKTRTGNLREYIARQLSENRLFKDVANI